MQEVASDDVVNEGMARVLEGAAPWDDATAGSLLEHIVRIGANARRVEVRKSGRRTSEKFVHEVTRDLATSPPPRPRDGASDVTGLGIDAVRNARKRRVEILFEGEGP